MSPSTTIPPTPPIDTGTTSATPPPEPPSPRLTCATCPHFHNSEGMYDGECFRYPPQLNPKGGGFVRPSVRTRHPACGEHPAMMALVAAGSAVPVTATKRQPETPGAAAKAAREARKK